MLFQIQKKGNQSTKTIEMVKNKDMFNLLEQTKKHEANLLHKHLKLTMLYYNW